MAFHRAGGTPTPPLHAHKTRARLACPPCHQPITVRGNRAVSDRGARGLCVSGEKQDVFFDTIDRIDMIFRCAGAKGCAAHGAAENFAVTRAALCAGRGTAFPPRHARKNTAQKAASRGIPLAAALQIFRLTCECRNEDNQGTGNLNVRRPASVCPEGAPQPKYNAHISCVKKRNLFSPGATSTPFKVWKWGDSGRTDITH